MRRLLASIPSAFQKAQAALQLLESSPTLSPLEGGLVRALKHRYLPTAAEYVMNESRLTHSYALELRMQFCFSVRCPCASWDGRCTHIPIYRMNIDDYHDKNAIRATAMIITDNNDKHSKDDNNDDVHIIDVFALSPG